MTARAGLVAGTGPLSGGGLTRGEALTDGAPD